MSVLRRDPGPAAVKVGYWRESEPLFRRALEVTRENWLAHSMLGQLAQRAGRDGEAVEHFREALRLRPDHREAW